MAVLAAAVIAAPLLTLGAPAFADDTDGIGAAPSSGNGPDSRTRFSYQIGPGQTVSDFFFVKNSGTTQQTVKIFATDAYTADDGELSLLPTDQKATDTGSWVTFDDGSDARELTLEPNTSITAQFTVTVPEDAAPGDHVGAMVVSSQSASGQVVVDSRVASRLYVRVKGELQPNLTVSNIAASYAPEFNPLDGTVTVKVTLKNTGNVALGAKASFGVRVLGLVVAQTELQEVPEILPGGSRSLSVQVPGVGQLGLLSPYVQMLPTVDKEVLDPGPLASVNRDTVVVAVPWVLVVVLVLAALFWLFLRIRNARDETAARRWIEFTEAEARRKAVLEGTSSTDELSAASRDGVR